MRAVIQRVSQANVKIEGAQHSSIGLGLLVLIGIENEDTIKDIEWLTGKISRLRIFSDDNGLMNLSLGDISGEVLVVSQFTLHASTKKGNRPSYIKAATPEVAVPIYNRFITNLEEDLGAPVKTGVFGANMKISLINDGPVTIYIDTKKRE